MIKNKECEVDVGKNSLVLKACKTLLFWSPLVIFFDLMQDWDELRRVITRLISEFVEKSIFYVILMILELPFNGFGCNRFVTKHHLNH